MTVLMEFLVPLIDMEERDAANSEAAILWQGLLDVDIDAVGLE